MKYELENGYITYSVDDMDEEALVIEEVVVNEKRMGTGRQLVEHVIEEADGKTISLCAYPINDDMELAELIEFYESCGFELEWDDGNTAIMNINA